MPQTIEREKIIIDVNRQVFEETLKEIGYTIQGPDEINMWVHDNKDRRTNFYVTNERVEVLSKGIGAGNDQQVHFYFQGSDLTIFKNCISFGTKHCFIQFFNHS